MGVSDERSTEEVLGKNKSQSIARQPGKGGAKCGFVKYWVAKPR